MCNRFKLTHSQQYLAERFKAWDEIEATPRYNIAPTQPVVTVRQKRDQSSRTLSLMRWGLIPSDAVDLSIGNRLLNARSETVTTAAALVEHDLVVVQHNRRYSCRTRTSVAVNL